MDDPKTFVECAQTPLPRTVWANPLKADVGETASKIEALGLMRNPLRGSSAWRLPPDVKPGHWLMFLTGAIHAQEEAAMRPVGLMPDRVTVYWICASPGGKTAQLAVSWKIRGPDRKRKITKRYPRYEEWTGWRDLRRCIPIRRRAFSRSGAVIDGVVDAPCTCEGTSRKNPSRIEAVDQRFRMSIIQVQKALLRRAIALCKPGGTVLYATCTYAPEENEGVLSALGAELAQIEPVTLPPGVITRPGIAAWNGVRYRSDVVHVIACGHTLMIREDSFFARLRKL